jgi:hypothetical protein
VLAQTYILTHFIFYIFARLGEKRSAYKILGGKLEEKKSLGRPRRRWEDNIKSDIKKILRVCTEFIRLVIRTSGRLL